MRRCSLLLATCLCALAGAGQAGAGGFTSQEVTITADDGVVLAAGLYQPAGTPPPGGWPGVVAFHGLGGKHQGIDAVSQAFAAAGYVVLAPDARAHGASGGLFTLDGPREQQDIRQEFDWLAARPGVDAKKIGCWGISLGGGAAMNSALAGVPWAAIETVETWSDLYGSLFPHDLGKTGAIFTFTQSVPTSTLPPELVPLVKDMLANRNLAALKAFFDTRSSIARDSTLTVPTFLFQGRRDFAFDIDQAASAYRRLGGPKRLYVGDFGHAPSTFPGPDIAHVLDLGTRWFDRFLKGMPNGIDTSPPVEVAPNPWTGTTASFAGLPPTRSLSFTLRGKSKLAATGKVVRSARLASTVEQFGAPVVKATLSSSGSFAHVVAVLTVKSATGEDVVTEGGRLLNVGPKPKTYSFTLISDANLLRKGATLKLTLAGASTAQNGANLLYLNQPAATARLTVGTVRLTVPVLQKTISR
ncbi:MAG: hypothetical protein QOE36_1088 [Gaiellaceae bacterium]|jgi:predicted acyl esterase|nr:hypothetical protein [Gaiellaceae bacterium]